MVSETLRIGLIGCGEVCEHKHLPALRGLEGARVAAMAVEAGRHVLVEKPLALGMEQADKLVELESRHDVRILMGFHMRWHRLIRRAREYVESGALGIIESIHATWNSPRLDLGIPHWKRHRVDG